MRKFSVSAFSLALSTAPASGQLPPERGTIFRIKAGAASAAGVEFRAESQGKAEHKLSMHLN